MVGWHQRLNGHGFGWTPGVGNGQGGLACCGSWGRKDSDMTERLNEWLKKSHPTYLQLEIHVIANLWYITDFRQDVKPNTQASTSYFNQIRHQDQPVSLYSGSEF